MSKPLIAPERKNRIAVSGLIKRLTSANIGIVRIAATFMVVVMLTQIVFIGPVRTANAKAKPLVADTSSPAEPFVVNTPPTVATTVFFGRFVIVGLCRYGNEKGIAKNRGNSGRTAVTCDCAACTVYVVGKCGRSCGPAVTAGECDGRDGSLFAKLWLGDFIGRFAWAGGNGCGIWYQL